MKFQVAIAITQCNHNFDALTSPRRRTGCTSKFVVNRQCWGEVDPSPDNCTRTGEGVYAINLARRSASESRCS
ncbi:MAG: hypothetical protein LBT01_06920, partial [Spirochaetaceae bacterium]|nr:hypothetical protein [Spirochaetaceae bacterium]